jgi:hypothetical protein
MPYVLAGESWISSMLMRNRLVSVMKIVPFQWMGKECVSELGDHPQEIQAANDAACD